MTKKYKLLKDLPDAKAGAIFVHNYSYNRYYLDGNILGSYWDKEFVEDNPTWFQEVLPVSEPVKDRIKVEIDGKYYIQYGEYHAIHFKSNHDFPNNKMETIRVAIEDILNDTVVEDNAFEDEFKFMSFVELKGFSQHELLNMAADYIGKYRHDDTMTNYRIAHSLLYPTTTMNAYKQSKQSSPIPTTTTQPIVEEEKKEWWQKLGIKFDGKWYTHPKTNTYDNLDQVIEELHLATKEIKYSQEQMDKAIEDAFKAARKKEYDYYDWETENDKFPTIQDYINHLKQNK